MEVGVGGQLGQVGNLGRAGTLTLSLSSLQPILQRRLGKQGVAPCAGNLAASSP